MRVVSYLSRTGCTFYQGFQNSVIETASSDRRGLFENRIGHRSCAVGEKPFTSDTCPDLRGFVLNTFYIIYSTLRYLS